MKELNRIQTAVRLYNTFGRFSPRFRRWNLMNFIDMFLEYTKDGESPTSFFKWSAISMLSAVMRDNVYYDVATDKIYPNIYVLLVAKSGACRKGSPLKIAQKLVQLTNNTKVISGRASIQGAMQVLAGFDTKTMIKGASGLLYSEELSAFLVEDPAAIKILTDWYDYHEKWTNTLVSGVSELHHVCVSLLGASNEHLLRDVYNDKAIYGGLLARTFIVLEEKRRKKNSRMFIDPSQYNPENLLAHLRELSRLKGPITFTEDAKKEYDSWYNSIDDEAYSSKSGVLERIHTGVLKLSMILAAAEPRTIYDKRIVVDKQNVDVAIDECWTLLRNYDFLTMGAGKSPIGHQIALVIRELSTASNNTLTRKILIRRLWAEIDAPTLDNIIVTMSQGGLIGTTTVCSEEAYYLTSVALERIENALRNGKSQSVTTPARAAKFD